MPSCVRCDVKSAYDTASSSSTGSSLRFANGASRSGIEAIALIGSHADPVCRPVASGGQLATVSPPVGLIECVSRKEKNLGQAAGG